MEVSAYSIRPFPAQTLCLGVKALTAGAQVTYLPCSTTDIKQAWVLARKTPVFVSLLLGARSTSTTLCATVPGSAAGPSTVLALPPCAFGNSTATEANHMAQNFVLYGNATGLAVIEGLRRIMLE
ncbi:hypothetical protein HYH03_004468 [Edaphochlamys debaryana]|uniref:Uncharacterized protein n=1 Tax=Edaphochlamys debaryana TaxID=47281 RepID=A0A835Y7J1_9CHLO|nr:hypothetical protein HYH03_004468 [Edaphochlamys debaryana]|eukprot:KAG2497732.1 hypothetical protein HYH03_004468 [Edaphochlamys debaryana]